MKNYLKVSFLFLTLMMFSCTGEQTEQQKLENYLIGTWLCTETPEGMYKDCYYSFQENGKVIRDYDITTSESAVYTFNAETKSLTSTLTSRQETYQVVSLTSSYMELAGGGFDAASWKFQKVPNVSFPELIVEDKEVIIKVGETKKLSLSGIGIRLRSMGYQAKDGFIADTASDYVVLVDDNTLSITGQYVGKCKLQIGSKNGSVEIPVTVEPNFPFWEHRFIIDKVKALDIDNIEEELGDGGYSSKEKGPTSDTYYYYFEGISDVVSSLMVSRGGIVLFIPLNQKANLEKSLKEYGDAFHSSATTPPCVLYSTFLTDWELGQQSFDDHLRVTIGKWGK